MRESSSEWIALTMSVQAGVSDNPLIQQNFAGSLSTKLMLKTFLSLSAHNLLASNKGSNSASVTTCLFPHLDHCKQGFTNGDAKAVA
jgi:hypothetical protein